MRSHKGSLRVTAETKKPTDRNRAESATSSTSVSVCAASGERFAATMINGTKFVMSSHATNAHRAIRNERLGGSDSAKVTNAASAAIPTIC